MAPIEPICEFLQRDFAPRRSIRPGWTGWANSKNCIGSLCQRSSLDTRCTARLEVHPPSVSAHAPSLFQSLPGLVQAPGRSELLDRRAPGKSRSVWAWVLLLELRTESIAQPACPDKAAMVYSKHWLFPESSNPGSLDVPRERFQSRQTFARPRTL